MKGFVVKIRLKGLFAAGMFVATAAAVVVTSNEAGAKLPNVTTVDEGVAFFSKQYPQYQRFNPNEAFDRNYCGVVVTSYSWANKPSDPPFPANKSIDMTWKWDIARAWRNDYDEGRNHDGWDVVWYGCTPTRPTTTN